MGEFYEPTWNTVTTAVALRLSEEAVIVAIPLATAVTTPVDETVAIVESDVIQIT